MFDGVGWGGGGGCQWGRRQDVRLGRDGERGSVRKYICNLIGLFFISMWYFRKYLPREKFSLSKCLPHV